VEKAGHDAQRRNRRESFAARRKSIDIVTGKGGEKTDEDDRKDEEDGHH